MLLTSRDFEQRIERIRNRMQQAALDALFIFSDEYRPGHAMYLTNHRTINMIEESHHAIFLPAGGKPIAFTGPLNTFAARRDSYIKDVRPVPNLESNMRHYVAADPVKRVGLVGENLLPVTIYRALAAGLGPTVTLVDSTDLFMAERQIKSEREVQLLARAGEIDDIALRTAAAYTTIGRTEMELIAIGEHATRLLGGELGGAYLVAAGENTDLPTWRASDRPLKRGEPVMLDFAPAFEGYTSDAGITVLTEGASAEQQKALDFSWYASAKMMEYYRPGVQGKEVFQQTLRLVEEAGYVDYFLPYTKGMRAIGHGVGLDVVEPPDLGPTAEYTLEPGMVLAAKFDLHGFRWGGIRIEHVVAVTDKGPVSLNCPLSDACPVRSQCAFYRPGGKTVDIPWENLAGKTQKK